MKVKPNNYIAIEFPSRSVNEGLARAAVAALAAQLDPTLDELGDIKTAVSEAVTNAIVHAYPQEIGRIALRASIFDGNLLEHRAPLLRARRGTGRPVSARLPWIYQGSKGI